MKFGLRYPSPGALQHARLQEAAGGCRIGRAMKVPVEVPVRRGRNLRERRP
jgi:hypothetical protein